MTAYYNGKRDRGERHRSERLGNMRRLYYLPWLYAFTAPRAVAFFSNVCRCHMPLSSIEVIDPWSAPDWAWALGGRWWAPLRAAGSRRPAWEAEGLRQPSHCYCRSARTRTVPRMERRWRMRRWKATPAGTCPLSAERGTAPCLAAALTSFSASELLIW